VIKSNFLLKKKSFMNNRYQNMKDKFIIKKLMKNFNKIDYL